VRVKEVKTNADVIKCEILPPVPPTTPDGWYGQTVKITLPPGNQIPPEPRITIFTDSADERYQKFEVVVNLLKRRAAPAVGRADFHAAGRGR